MTNTNTDLSVERLNGVHASIYDELADEYEARIEILRPVTKYLISNLTKFLSPGSSVLDVGCAVGYTTEILNELGMNARGIELSKNMAHLARRRNPDSIIDTGDFLTHDYGDTMFDAVFMSAYIHLFPENIAHQQIKKADQILVPGGYLLISTTENSQPSEGFQTKDDYNHDRKRYRKKWTRSGFLELISATGMEISWHEDIVDEYGKTWMDYILRKPK